MRGLSFFFLRSAPVRAAGVIVGVVAALVVASYMTLQSFEESGAQKAARAVGSFDYAMPVGPPATLTHSSEDFDAELLQAVADGGGTGAQIRYRTLEGLVLENGPAYSVGLEEAEWESDPYLDSVTLTSGRWPSSGGEVAISRVLAESFPVGSSIHTLAGEWVAIVVGIAEDQSARKSFSLYAPLGTWHTIVSSMDPSVAERFGTQSQRTVFWNGSDAGAVLGAVNAQLGDAQVGTLELLQSQLQSQRELTARTSTGLIEFRLGALVAPFAAALVGVVIASRFTNRIRDVMLSIGVRRRQTRGSALMAVAVSLFLGLVMGCSVGVVVGYALRPLLDQMSERAIGPTHGVTALVVSLFGAAAVGVVVAILISSLRQTVTVRQHVSEGKLPLRFVVLPVAALGLATAGFICAQSALSTDQFIIAGVLFAMVAVVLLPLLIEILLNAEPASMAALLAIRNLRTQKRNLGWVISAIASLLVVAFAASTLIASAFTTMNATNKSSVAPGQIHLSVPSNVSETVADEVARELENRLASTPLDVFVANGGVDLMDGGTLVLGSVEQFELFTGGTLAEKERELLESGGTLRTKEPDLSEVNFVTSDGTLKVLPAGLDTELGSKFGIYDGFILSSTADALDIEMVNRTRVFVNVSSEQVDLAASAPADLGFDADWLKVYETPDRFAEPPEALLATASVTLVAIVLVTFFVLAAGRQIRPNLSTMRAVGIGRGWIATTLATQAALVISVGFASALLASVLGMFVALSVGRVDLHLTPPWLSIGVSASVLTVGALVATFVAVRRLSGRDTRRG